MQVCQNFWIFIQTGAVDSCRIICKQFDIEKIPESIPVMPRKIRVLIKVLFSWSSCRILEYSPIELEAITTELKRQTSDGQDATQIAEDSSDKQHHEETKLIIIKNCIIY